MREENYWQNKGHVQRPKAEGKNLERTFSLWSLDTAGQGDKFSS